MHWKTMKRVGAGILLGGAAAIGLMLGHSALREPASVAEGPGASGRSSTRAASLEADVVRIEAEAARLAKEAAALEAGIEALRQEDASVGPAEPASGSHGPEYEAAVEAYFSRNLRLNARTMAAPWIQELERTVRLTTDQRKRLDEHFERIVAGSEGFTSLDLCDENVLPGILDTGQLAEWRKASAEVSAKRQRKHAADRSRRENALLNAFVEEVGLTASQRKRAGPELRTLLRNTISASNRQTWDAWEGTLTYEEYVRSQEALVQAVVDALGQQLPADRLAAAKGFTTGLLLQENAKAIGVAR